ncbi:glycosyltransferase family 39 protein [bacterium]|nr:glycosyltransferase family 39 protein [bacterium]
MTMKLKLDSRVWFAYAFGSVLLILLTVVLFSQHLIEVQTYELTHKDIRHGPPVLTYCEGGSGPTRWEMVFVSRIPSFSSLRLEHVLLPPKTQVCLSWQLTRADTGQDDERPINRWHRGTVRLSSGPEQAREKEIGLDFPPIPFSLGIVYKLTITWLQQTDQIPLKLGLLPESRGNLSQFALNDQHRPGTPELYQRVSFPAWARPGVSGNFSELKSLLTNFLNHDLLMPLLYISIVLLKIIFFWDRRSTHSVYNGSTARSIWPDYAFYGLLILLTVVGLAVRTRQLDFFKVTIDEEFSQHVISLPLKDALNALLIDKHPPLYYLVLKIWTLVLGSSIISLRSLSVLAGTLCLPVLGLLARSVTNRSTALLAAFILTFQPYHLTYAQTARMYSLLALLSLLSLFYFSRLYHEHNRVEGWIRILVNAGLLMTHYFGLFIVLAEFVIALVMKPNQMIRKRTVLEFLGPLVLLGLWLAPHLATMSSQVRHLSDLKLGALSILFWNGSPIMTTPDHDLFKLLYGSVLVITGMIGLGDFTVGSRPARSLVLVSLSAILFIFIVSSVSPIYQPRNIFILIPLVPLLFARGIQLIFFHNRYLQTIAFVLFAALSLASYGFFYSSGSISEVNKIPGQTLSYNYFQGTTPEEASTKTI